MDRENILALVRAGFNAEEIKIIVPDAFASEADNPSIVTPAQSDAAGAAQPSGAAASAPEPADRKSVV